MLSKIECAECSGTGWLNEWGGPPCDVAAVYQNDRCEDCDGTGYHEVNVCRECGDECEGDVCAYCRDEARQVAA